MEKEDIRNVIVFVQLVLIGFALVACAVMYHAMNTHRSNARFWREHAGYFENSERECQKFCDGQTALVKVWEERARAAEDRYSLLQISIDAAIKCLRDVQKADDHS